MSNSVMNVGIEEPAKHRKEILNIAIHTIQALKGFELLKGINKEKAVYKRHLTQVIKDLDKSIQEFKAMLPAVHVPHPKEEKKEAVVTEPEKKVEVEVVKKPVIKRKPKTELDKLEDDIASLRDKIANL